MISIEIKEIFQNHCDTILSSSRSKILVSHFGIFSQNLVSSISDNAETLLLSKGVEKRLVKRIFSILIEGLQNIRMHGLKVDSDRQLGFLILSEENNFFKISFANIIDQNDLVKVDKYIREINGYSKDVLKKTYLEILGNEFISNKGGAGLGVITTRIKSGQPLEHSYYSLSDGNMLFAFQIKIKKNFT